MLPWVSLIHAGSYLGWLLDQRLQDELGISLPEQDLLGQLLKRGGEIRMVDLARRIQFSKAGMTKLVDRLENAGLIRRVPSKTDRRAKSARLTEKGVELFRESCTILESFVAENFRDHLSARQIDALGDTLRELLQAHGRWEGQLAHVRGDELPGAPSES